MVRSAAQAADATDRQPERDLPIHPKLGVADWDAPDTACVHVFPPQLTRTGSTGRGCAQA